MITETRERLLECYQSYYALCAEQKQIIQKGDVEALRKNIGEKQKIIQALQHIPHTCRKAELSELLEKICRTEQEAMAQAKQLFAQLKQSRALIAQNKKNIENYL